MRIRIGICAAVVAVALSITFGLPAMTSSAQFDSTCAPLVEQALEAVGNNCGGLGRNSACYGFDNVGATFSREQPQDFFSQPSDLAELVQLQSLTTAPLNVDLDEWGIAVLNVQADLPDALPGQSVTFMLFGDVTLENAVDPAASPAAITPIDITTRVQSLLRTRPTGIANTSAQVPPDTLLSADRISSDGQWVRVVYADLVGWLPFEAVTSAGDLATLPTQETAPYTPMQAVRLTTNITGVSCAEAPPSLVVMQGPEQMTVNLTVNGAELNIGSTIALWTTGGQMLLAVIDGGVYTSDGKYIPAGFISIIQLDESGAATGSWSEPRPLTLEEWLLFEPLENIPAILLKYPINVPSELIAALTTPTPSPAPVSVDNPPPPTPVPPQIIQVDCSTLRATSPLDGLPYAGVTFFWDGVASSLVTGYQVNVYRDGAQVASVGTPAGVTQASTDLGALPLFGSYTWEVLALVNGVGVCRASSGVIQRAFPPDPTEAPTATPTQRVEETEPVEQPFTATPTPTHTPTTEVTIPTATPTETPTLTPTATERPLDECVDCVDCETCGDCTECYDCEECYACEVCPDCPPCDINDNSNGCRPGDPQCDRGRDGCCPPANF